ncbi:MAG TPA: tRNA (adenosine(37)-N6)-threonylcarbamoyltransferase complex ATPase subunit type 1 TsaE [Verrucomicrobiae bacterium]|nr:tRNA (adenosine(37)-N6)-threonylcarbamoyltransferase complex ATPase subunit type 1 TsaE [Verrucomicrobiae bacterium]
MITSQTTETRSVEETLAFGERLGRELQRGDVVALVGGLGAGKTVLVKGIARGLGIAQEATSPTFTLIHEYTGGRLQLFHIDLYRLDTINQVLAIGIEEYLNGPGVTVIEWSEKMEALVPSTAKRIRITALDNNVRRIEVA